VKGVLTKDSAEKRLRKKEKESARRRGETTLHIEISGASLSACEGEGVWLLSMEVGIAE